MIQAQIHTGPLPDPIPVLETYLKEGGVSLVHAAFANTFFVSPSAVRARTPYFPDRARLSRQHYPGKRRGESADWSGLQVRLGDNARAQLAWAKYTRRTIARASGYGVRHIWGYPWDPQAFTAGWNDLSAFARSYFSKNSSPQAMLTATSFGLSRSASRK